MNSSTRYELYLLAHRVNDANFVVQKECTKLYEILTFEQGGSQQAYEDVQKAISALQIATVRLNDLIVGQDTRGREVA